MLEDAGFARNAGLAIDLDQVRELTGYKLEKAPESPSPAPGFGLNSRKDGKTPFKNAANGLQNAPSEPDGQGDPKAEDALVEALSGLFEKSLAEAAAGEMGGEGLTRRRGEAENAGEITQEQAEKLYEEMMAK